MNKKYLISFILNIILIILCFIELILIFKGNLSTIAFVCTEVCLTVWSFLLGIDFYEYTKKK